MTYEFEGKTEREAIDNAVAELGLDRDKFDIEVIESQKSGFLGIGKRVRIRVHLPESGDSAEARRKRGEDNGGRARNGGRGRQGGRSRNREGSRREREGSRRAPADQENADAALGREKNSGPVGTPPENDFEHGVADFLKTVTEKMGNQAEVTVLFREEAKIGFHLDSKNNAMLIGRKGSTLDSIQTLANIVAGRIGGEDLKVIVDSEGYRSRREEQLIRLAEKVGDQVKQSQQSQLLEPMNPFERRLIHTTLTDISGIGTKSEGEGLYKQVRIFYRS